MASVNPVFQNNLRLLRLERDKTLAALGVARANGSSSVGRIEADIAAYEREIDRIESHNWEKAPND